MIKRIISCLSIGLFLFVGQLNALEPKNVVFKSVENYPKQLNRAVESTIIISRDHLRIDGNGTTSIFSAADRKFTIYDHQRELTVVIDKDVLNKVKAANESWENPSTKTSEPDYRLKRTGEMSHVGHLTSERVEFYLGDTMLANTFMVPLASLNIAASDIAALNQMNQLFAEFLSNLPRQNIAFGGASLIGIPETAGFKDDSELPLVVEHFDASGELVKTVTLELLEIRPYVKGEFDGPSNYKLQPVFSERQ